MVQYSALPTPRYHLLEMVRQYACEALSRSGEEAEVLQHHARFYHTFTEDARPELREREQEAWYDRLEREQGNLRAALDWEEANDPAGALQMAVNVMALWDYRGYWSEGRERFDRILAAPGVETPTPVRAKALGAAAHLTLFIGDGTAAEARMEEARDAFHALGDRQGVANCLSFLGNLRKRHGDVEGARACYREGMAISRELGTRDKVAGFLALEAWLCADGGDYRRCRDLYRESVALYRELGLAVDGNWAVGNLGYTLTRLGEYDDALRIGEEALAVARGLGDKMSLSLNAMNLGRLAIYRGDMGAARVLLNESLEVATSCSDRFRIGLAEVELGILAYAEGDLSTARRLQESGVRALQEAANEWAIGDGLTHLGWTLLACDDPMEALARCREALRCWVRVHFRGKGVIDNLEASALALATRNEPARATCLLGAADVAREAGGACRSPVYGAPYTEGITLLRSRMGDAAFMAVWDEGRRLPLEAAVAEALGEDG